MLEGLTALSYRSGDLGAYLTEIVLSVSRLIQSDWTIVTLCEDDRGQVIASSIAMEWENAGFSLHETLAYEVVQSGRSLLVKDCRQELQQNFLLNEYRCYLGVPLRTTNREILGTICSFLREPSSFTQAEIKVVELFAERAATAIENYWLYQEQLQFNKMLSQEVETCAINLKQSQEKLIEHERLAAIGEFTSMIVHEVRNPLATIELGLKHAQKVLSSDADQQRLALALSESQRLNHLLSDILSYAKTPILNLTNLNISEFFEDLLVQIQDFPEASDRHISYVKEFPEVEIMADRDKLKQVFLNLFRNAFEAIAPQETVSCFMTDTISSNQICISIHNGGDPIPPELLPKLATPFCSNKPSGTGLGLAISKRIISAHDGELEITSSDSGTTVTVCFPILANN